ncbi:radical SAM protein [Anabaena cylindrica FACHB-243]|uniref:Radical SAM domain protein n=1 Tax=Anabaena cylindrica (strain ATCC 27899 / PCC 7122) TaxID=272123 RepID=K9ZID0_ANACC|nr:MULTISPECIES: radical SAM protein [Anabaena]AFZ58524.1 Radical SAM domain protein [Anabaena cylindrica PCC 7122]MBD2416287.1 radical SAM protein [Anabaena cylindrica FACHB-243]MBY5283276.1 radical SAM protein [Anabaena sp. CCAP 1446/1C]MBY5307957.1 radical SAM protein [Anabaena sp. CCAP 1446/1C]MCM2407334.1 radical SAM protein [Anabaena sp. CCAP 1446/1C]
MSLSPSYAEKIEYSSVYGLVNSLRYGRSLGVDPIGISPTCSFNCVYCQLGNIRHQTTQRQIFVPTTQVISDLQAFIQKEIPIDVVTISGSGEPTLALNLEEILQATTYIINKPLVVLTNGTLLSDKSVRNALTVADIVAVKLDAVSSNQLRQINQPLETINLPDLLKGIEKFRQEYRGYMAIQTMILSSWTAETLANYINLMKRLQPDEIQLNIPTHTRVLVHQLESRSNEIVESRAYTCENFNCISTKELCSMADTIQNVTQIPVRYSSRRLAAQGRKQRQ